MQEQIVIPTDLNANGWCLGVEDVNLNKHLKNYLAGAKIDKLFPVQVAMTKHQIDKQDAVVCAPTGSGKSLAYCLPILNWLLNDTFNNLHFLRAIVIVPTRDLVQQVGDLFLAAKEGT